MKLASVILISVALTLVALIFRPEWYEPAPAPEATAVEALQARVRALELKVAILNERQSKIEGVLIDRGNILTRIVEILESYIAGLKDPGRFFGPQPQPADQQQKTMI